MAGGGFDVGSIVGHLVLDKDQWRQAVTEARGDVKRLGDEVRLKSDEIQAGGRILAAFGATVTAAFGVMVKSTVDAGDHVNDLSKRTGIATETLSGYSLAADKSGTSIDAFAIGMKGLANRMQEAHDKGGAAKELFDGLGVSFQDSEGKLRPLDQVMLGVADRFADMEDGAEKSALAVDFFGKAGSELIPLLNLGRAGLEAEYKAAERLGLVFSKDAAEGADRFNDSLVDLQGSIKGLGNELTKTILPALKPVIDKMTDAIAFFRRFAEAQPVVASQITLTAGALGILAGVLGTVCILLPSFLKGWVLLSPLLAAAAPFLAAIASAWAGWNLGKYLGEITGLNKALQDQIAFGHGWVRSWLIWSGLMPDVNRELELGTKNLAAQKIQAEGMVQAVALAGHEFTSWTAAMRFLREEFAHAGTVGNSVLDEWLRRLPPLKPRLDDIGTSIKGILAAFNLKGRTELTKELADAEAALSKLRASTEATPGAVEALEKQIAALRIELNGAVVDFQTIEDRVTALNDDLRKLRMLGSIEVAAPVVNTTGTLGDMIGGDLGKVTNYVESVEGLFDGLKTKVVEDSIDMGEAAKQALEQTAQIQNQIIGDIVTGFGSIMDGSKTMSEVVVGSITNVISALGKLVIAQIIAAKTSVKGSMFESIAKHISNIFKSVPFPLDIILAAGAFGVVSKLFSSLMKFKEGGVFTKPTIAEIGHGTEYVLPERKLINIVQNAMAGQGGGVAGPMALQRPAFAAAAASMQPQFNFHGPMIQAHGYSRRDIMDAREFIFEAFEERVRTKGWGQLRSAVKHA